MLALPEDEQIRHLDAIETEIARETGIGTTSSKFLASVAPATILPYDESKLDMPFMGILGGTYTGGEENPVKDTIIVNRIKNDKWVKRLRRGMPYMLTCRLHEGTHWVSDQANPEETFLDMCRVYDLGKLFDHGDQIDFRVDVQENGKGKAVMTAKNNVSAFLLVYGQNFKPD